MKIITVRFTDEELEALDALTGFICCRSRSETIHEALRRLKPELATNPFTSSLVKFSRRKSCRRKSRYGKNRS